MYEFDEVQVEALRRSERQKHGPKGARRPKRRADGEGSVFAVQRTRKNGQLATYYWATKTVDMDGDRRKFSAQAGTEREAIEKRDRKILEAKVRIGLEERDVMPPDPKSERLTVGDCLADWLKERGERGLAPATIHMYDARIRNHLLPAFGARRVRSLTYDELKHFFRSTLPAKGLGVDSIRQTHICLNSALMAYDRDGHIPRNPMKGLQAPAKKRKKMDDAKKIRQASKFLGRYLIPAAREADSEARWFLALLGMRQGEVLGMTDDCLDGARPAKRGRRIKVQQQLQRIGAAHGCELNQKTGRWGCGLSTTKCPQRIGETHWELTGTKSSSGMREIVIPEDSWKMLEAHMKRQQARRKLPGFKPDPGEGLDRLLFTRDDGKPIYAQRDRQALVELVGSIKNLPPDMTVHTIRHVATTALIDGGADRSDLIAMMGWSPKNADAQIAIYSSADNAMIASKTSISYVESFYSPA